ncbi:leucine-rich repeat protein [Listeria ivanovii subsp. londoniensis]|uniref:leucine-rich repeat protein n=1 Tax=Listeria ivanovii TaxID=1638 RepID=UPI001908046F|nr:leucine-rich repeat protein [Listeria ivanovii]MBK1995643.1 leucine-rich repeat protein [Listeria ivanovii subsp. londoniensis]
MREKDSLKHVLIATLLTMIVACVSMDFGTKVRAASISQPTPINQIFPDTCLAETIAEILSKNKITDVVSQQELSSIDELYANESWIEYLEGIEYLSNLRKISLENNLIQNISKLANLSKLEEVNLNGNQLNDISALASLTNLNTLNLSKNQIADIDALSNLGKLKYLNLNNNQLTNINVLSKLTNLTELDFSENQVTNIAALAKLTNLTELGFRENKVNDIAPLVKLVKLTTLAFSQNQVKDISVLKNLDILVYLAFDGNQVKDISVLANLNHLTYLVFNDNQVTNIDVLAELPNLVGVIFNNNKVINISPLANLTKLKQLHAEGNRIQDVEALSSLTKLKELKLDRNAIMDISPLAGLNNLDELELSNQLFTNSIIDYQEKITIPNTIKDMSGRLIAPDTISDNGNYKKPNITWNLPTYKKEVSYEFEQYVIIGQAGSYFRGTVVQPLNKLDATKTNNAITAYGRVKSGVKSAVWSHADRTKGAKQLGTLSSYAGKNLRIIQEAKTTSGSYYQIRVGKKMIGWVEAKDIAVFYKPSMEKKAKGARYIVPGKEGQHVYKLPVVDAAIDEGTLAKFKGKKLILQREVTIGKEKWALLQGIGWVKATNLSTEHYDKVLYNKTVTAYARVKTAKGKHVWSTPYRTAGYKVIGSLSRYTGKNLRILREAKTRSGIYYQVRAGKKTIGWIEAKNLTVFYKPSMEKKAKGTRYIVPGKEGQHIYKLPVVDAAIDGGTLARFKGKKLTLQREVTIGKEKWVRLQGVGWVKATNVSALRYNKVFYNKAITAYARVKTVMVWSSPYRNAGNKAIGSLSRYTGKNLRILREAKTRSGVYYQVRAGKKMIGWIEAKNLTVFYKPSMEKKVKGTRYIVPGKEGQHVYKLPVADAAIDGGTLARFKGEKLILQREVTIGKEKWVRLQGVGWVKATNVSALRYDKVFYNKAVIAYAKVKTPMVWSTPYRTAGYKAVGPLSHYTSKNLRILREAKTRSGIYYQVRVGKKTIGWLAAKNLAVFYKPSMEKKAAGTCYVVARKKNNLYYSLPVADGTISRGKLQKISHKNLTVNRKATIGGQQWYRIKGAGWTKAANLRLKR